MAITTSCPACHTTFKVPDHFAGERTRCKKCQKPFVIKPDEEENEEQDSQEEVRPRKKKKKKLAAKKSVAPMAMLLGSDGLLVVAVVVLVVVFAMRPRPAAEAAHVVNATPANGTAVSTPPPGPTAEAADEELRQAIAEADRLDPGWRFEELEAKRATIPDSENGALVILKVKELLPKLTYKNDEPYMPVVRDENLAWDPHQRPALDAYLRPHAAALLAAQKLADKPLGRFKLNISVDYFTTLLPHAQYPLAIAHLLFFQTARQSQDKNPEILQTLYAMFNTGPALGDEPFLISQQIRIFCTTEALNALQHTFARQAFDARALTTLQDRLTEESRFSGLPIAWRGKRAVVHGLFDALETHKENLVQLRESLKAFGMPLPSGNFSYAPDSSDFKADHDWWLRYCKPIIEITEKPLHEQSAALSQFRPTFSARSTWSAPPLLSGFAVTLDTNLVGPGPTSLEEKMLRNYQRYQALLRSALAAVAVERYRLAKGQWPAQLSDLGDLLPEIPLDPYDGSPLHFRRLDDGVVVYCVGVNLSDDNGDLGDRKTDEASPDVGFRLWDADKRK